VDLLEARGRGPVWGTATGDLNLTVLDWPEGEGPPDHVNDERDVVIVVVAGSGTVFLDEIAHPIEAGKAVVIPRGARRRLSAGPGGLRYLSVHLRRGGLHIAPRGMSGSA
jgi:quercetin dioxygenase-like cupin family protein